MTLYYGSSYNREKFLHIYNTVYNYGNVNLLSAQLSCLTLPAAAASYTNGLL